MGLFDSILTGQPQEQKLKDLVATHALPLAVRKTTWYGDFYFVVEEITWRGQAKGTRYRNGNVYGSWSCSQNDLFVLNEQNSHTQQYIDVDVPVEKQEAESPVKDANPNNLNPDKSSYIHGVTKLFVQRKEKLAPAVFDHFEVKNGKDVIYVECEGEVIFYAFPNTSFVFPNKDDGAAAIAKKNRSYGETTGPARIVEAYQKMPLAKEPSANDDVERTHEEQRHKSVNDKLLQDLVVPKQSIKVAEQKLATQWEDRRDAYVDARENGYDPHTFISLDLQASNAKSQIATAQRKIDEIEDVRRKPYFARIDCGKSVKELHTAYIGDADIPGYVVDWRRQEIGNAYYHSSIFQSRDDIVIALKRTFDIRYAQFFGFDDEINIYHSGSLHVSDKELERGTDELLTKLLLVSREDKSTHDIIKTIQSEQYDIITSDFYKNAVINGCAGSGKTMILFHRLSYIAYNHKFRTGDEFDPQRVYVISPSLFFDVGNGALLKKLKIDKIHHAPLDEQARELIRGYCSRYNITPFYRILDVIKGNADGACKLYNEVTFSEFLKCVNDIDITPVLKSSYTEWITNVACTILEKHGFETTGAKDSSDLSAFFGRLYRSDCFIKNKPRKKSEGDYNRKDYSDTQPEYYSKGALTTISYENVMASLNDLGKTENTYRIRARKLAQHSDVLEICLSPHTRKYSNGTMETELKDFWNILEKPDVFEKLSALIIAEKLLGVAAGHEHSDQDYLLRCAFVYQTQIPAQYANAAVLYFLKALTLRYGSLIKDPTFVFVDEFQNYSVFELLCLKAAFEKPTFNLYGDFDQRIEEKGAELQDALDDILSPEMYTLSINYRNAKQITEYINKAVYKNMHPIGVNGTVSEVGYFDCDFRKKDRTAIIAKDTETVRDLLHMRFGKGFLKVAAEARTIDDNELTLLTVSECKGLEFDTVYVFSDGMTENEKYVAYTRALDHLSVITDENLSQIKISEEERIKKEKAKRKKEEAPAPDVALPTEPTEEERTPDSNPEESTQTQEKAELAEEPVTTDQCDDIYLEAIQRFSSPDPDELLHAISLLERIVDAFGRKLTIVREAQAEQQKASYRAAKRCQHCGGEFKGFFSKVCGNCGRKKDY